MKQILSSAFNANAAVLYVIAAVVILYVLAQSIFFLVRAVKQSKKIGMDKGVIRRTARRAAIFSIAPAISNGQRIVDRVAGLLHVFLCLGFVCRSSEVLCTKRRLPKSAPSR